MNEKINHIKPFIKEIVSWLSLLVLGWILTCAAVLLSESVFNWDEISDLGLFISMSLGFIPLFLNDIIKRIKRLKAAKAQNTEDTLEILRKVLIAFEAYKIFQILFLLICNISML